MVNESNNGKLDEKIKHSLSNYEAPYDPADWAKMESLLDVAPQSKTFKGSYSLAIIIAIAVLAGGFLIYNKIHTSKTIDNSAITPVEQKIETPTTLETEPTINSNQASPAVSQPVKPPTVMEDISKKSTEKEIKEKEISLKKEKDSKEKTKNKKTETGSSNTEKESDLNKHQEVLIMGNEPIFGDMLDSSKGIIGETKEKEETKKAAKKQPEYPIGWNNFMLSNVNPDSLKHYRERMKKDSIK